MSTSSSSIAVSAGQPLQPKFKTTRTNQSGRVLHMTSLAGQEAVVVQHGIDGWRAWFTAHPDRVITLKGGTREDARRELAVFFYEAVRSRYVRISRPFKPACKALAVWEPVREWRITDRAARWANKKATVNEVVQRVHAQDGIATPIDVETLRSIPAPTPAADAIDVQSEVAKIKTALIDTHAEERGLWAGTPSKFRWAVKRRYSLHEAAGRIELRNGKTGPKLTIGRIQRPCGTWTVSDMGLDRALKSFVRAVYPDLPEMVEIEIKDEVAF